MANSNIGINDLPDEVLLKIATDSTLCLLDQKQLSLVSKKLKTIAHDPSTELAQRIQESLKKSLFKGLQRSNVDLVKRALECGASVNDVFEGCTTMSEATMLLFKQLDFRILAKMQSINDIIKILIEKGANVNYVEKQDGLFGNKTGNTLLHLYCGKHGDPPMVEFLLKHKANPDVRNKDGNTPLHNAALNENITIVDLLLKYNADASIKNNEMKTPLDVVNSNQFIRDDEAEKKYCVLQDVLSHAISSNRKSTEI